SGAAGTQSGAAGTQSTASSVAGTQSGASNAACTQSGASSNPIKLNRKRFAYDVFAILFIRLGVAHFPETKLRPNHYNDSTVLSRISSIALGNQMLKRDEWVQIFQSIFLRYSLRYFRGIAEYARRTLKRTKGYNPNDPQWVFEVLFSVLIELYFFLKCKGKQVFFEELPVSWCLLYSEYISKSLGDVSRFIKPYNTRFITLLDFTVDHYLRNYCFPYAEMRVSGVFTKFFFSTEVKELVESENPITLQDIETILSIVKYRESHQPPEPGQR
ncbi:hypothetical protein NPIL_192031, partial [Nephila pilipes]